MNQNPIVALSEAIQNKQAAILATVIEVKGASPAKMGAQIVLFADGTTVGTVGGGKLEEAVLADGRIALGEGTPRLKHYRLTEEGAEAVGTLCGGEIQVLLQTYFPPPILVIVGGGHIGRPLKIMGETAGFDVVVMDVEPGRATVPELEAVSITAESYIVLITTDHVSDEAALRYAITTPATYIGMIGSRHKCQTILKHLQADGFSSEQLSRVYAPIGLNLGGSSPAEIAVSILAEVVACRHGKSAEFRINK